MADFKELILKHRGKVFCVIGGAPFDPELLKSVKADVFISANEHGVKVHDCQYIVAMDEQHSGNGKRMYDHLREYSDLPIISRQPWANYQLQTWPDAPRGSVLSGMVAVWCAWAMGAKAVIVVGMNAYDGKSGSMRDAGLIAAEVSVPVRSVDGGSLASVFPEYDPKEKWGHYKESPKISELMKSTGEIEIEVIKPTGIRGREMQKGERIKIMRHEVARLLWHKMVKEI